MCHTQSSGDDNDLAPMLTDEEREQSRREAEQAMIKFDMQHPDDCYYAGQPHPRRTCHGDIITEEGGVIQLIQTKFRAPEERDIIVEEQQIAAYRYMQKLYGGGVYDKMVRRETDGPDPLVQEPKGKP